MQGLTNKDYCQFCKVGLQENFCEKIFLCFGSEILCFKVAKANIRGHSSMLASWSKEVEEKPLYAVCFCIKVTTYDLGRTQLKNESLFYTLLKDNAF